MDRWLRHLPKIDPDGRIIILGVAILAIILGALWTPLLALGAAAVVVTYLSFRDPDRKTFDLDDCLISPVDGRVDEIDTQDPPFELRLPPGEYARVRLITAPTAVSTLRAPVGGDLLALSIRPGDWLNLAFEADDDDNNRLYCAIGSSKAYVGVMLMNGGLVPRFFLDLEPGAKVSAGTRIGQRILGGWCDIYMPISFVPQIVVGQTMVAGETIVARLNGPKPPAAMVR